MLYVIWNIQKNLENYAFKSSHKLTVDPFLWIEWQLIATAGFSNVTARGQIAVLLESSMKQYFNILRGCMFRAPLRIDTFRNKYFITQQNYKVWVYGIEDYMKHAVHNSCNSMHDNIIMSGGQLHFY